MTEQVGARAQVITPPIENEIIEVNSGGQLYFNNEDLNCFSQGIGSQQPNEVIWEHAAEINGNQVTMGVKEMI